MTLHAFSDGYDPATEIRAETDRLARRFKVGTLVILRRMHDTGVLTREQFREAYDGEVARQATVPAGRMRQLLSNPRRPRE